MQNQKSNSLLQSVIYPKPILYLPKAIQWGKDNEHKALQAYQRFMENKGHKGIQVSRAGFVVHATKSWLGASPDGWVVDPLYDHPNGMIEIKCPYSMADKTPEEISKDENFYFHLVHGSWQLEKKHQYYHHRPSKLNFLNQY